MAQFDPKIEVPIRHSLDLFDTIKIFIGVFGALALYHYLWG